MQAAVAELQTQVGQLTAQLGAQQAELQGARQREAAMRDEVQQAFARTGPANGAGAAPGGGRPGGLVDTRVLGKPDHFDGSVNKWADWSVILRAYCSVAHPGLGPLMEMAEAADEATEPVRASLPTTADRDAATQLYYILVLICKAAALNMVINAGKGEGLVAWKRLCSHYEPGVRTRQVGLLVELLAFNFSGDIESRLEEFDRAISRYDERATGPEARLTDAIKVGVVIRNLEEGALRQHLLLNMARLSTWASFRAEVAQIRRAQATLSVSGPVPMEVGAFTRSPKGGGRGRGGDAAAGTDKTCGNCGRPGHFKRDCWRPGGGAADAGKGPGGGGGGDRRSGDKGHKGGKGGKGRGKGGKGGSAGVVCWNCGGKGHFGRDCPNGGKGRKLASVENPEAVEPTPEPSAAQVTLEGLFVNGIFKDVPEISAFDRPQPPKMVRMGIDSCAGVSVLPRAVCCDYPAVPNSESKRGVCYKTANDQPVKDEGTRSLLGYPAGGRRLRGVHTRVADVHRALLCVAELVDGGQRVVFDKENGQDVSHMVDKKTGEILPMQRRNNVYEMDWEIVPWSETPTQARPPGGRRDRRGPGRSCSAFSRGKEECEAGCCPNGRQA